MTDKVTQATQIKASLLGIRRLSRMRQLGLLCGFIACIMLVLYLFHWVDGITKPASQPGVQLASIKTA